LLQATSPSAQLCRHWSSARQSGSPTQVEAGAAHVLLTAALEQLVQALGVAPPPLGGGVGVGDGDGDGLGVVPPSVPPACVPLHESTQADETHWPNAWSFCAAAVVVCARQFPRQVASPLQAAAQASSAAQSVSAEHAASDGAQLPASALLMHAAQAPAMVVGSLVETEAHHCMVRVAAAAQSPQDAHVKMLPSLVR
jgi:hypothetical protein